MALQELIARLEHDADLHVVAIGREADAEIAAIEAATAEALAARTSRSIESSRVTRQAALDRALADARREARAQELAAAHTLLDTVFARAEALLADTIRRADWAPVWATLARQAVAGVNGPCRIRCAPAIASIVRLALSPSAEVQVVDDAAIGPGLVAEAVDGSVSLDATLATLLARSRPRLAGVVRGGHDA